jgi:hypothetical protein
VTGADFNDPGSAPPSSPERPAVFVTKEDTRPRRKGLSLTTELTSRLRQRARLGKARTLAAIKAARYGIHELMKPGLDVPTVAAAAAQGYAHDIMLTNVDPLGYQTDFGELRLDADERELVPTHSLHEKSRITRNHHDASRWKHER